MRSSRRSKTPCPTKGWIALTAGPGGAGTAAGLIGGGLLGELVGNLCWTNGIIESFAVAWFAVLVVVAQSRRVPVRGRRDASLASKYR
jgi:hypothetical protein